MRLVLCTGTGGAGITTVAAATAVEVARRGHKVLVVGTGDGPALADVLGHPVGEEPVEVDGGPAAVRIDPLARLAAGWEGLRGPLNDLLGVAGLTSAAGAELAVLPGLAELLTLSALAEQIGAGRYDVVVVDAGSSADLLTVPAVLRTYVERAFPPHVRALDAGRPAVAAATRLVTLLAGVRELLDSPATSVRLVLTPDTAAVAAARRRATTLALFGPPIDAVVVNRLVPAGDDRWQAEVAAGQRRRLAEIRACFAAMPVLTAAFRAEEPTGTDAVAALGRELYGGDPLPVPPPVSGPQVVVQDAGYRLEVELPHVGPGEVGVVRRGDDLVLTVGGHRRVLALPAVLRRCLAERAEVGQGRLMVHFRPDPRLWPREGPS